MDIVSLTYILQHLFLILLLAFIHILLKHFLINYATPNLSTLCEALPILYVGKVKHFTFLPIYGKLADSKFAQFSI